MSHPIVRPRIADLEFRLYDRPLHPELFDTLALRRVRRDGYTLVVRMTPTGHVMEWARGGAYLAELTATTDQVLPALGRRLAHPFRGERRGRCEIAPGLRYQVSLQVEVLAPEVFVHVHEELVADGAKRGLLFHFRPHYRLGLAPIGYVAVEPVAAGLCVSSFHTFPDEFAVVKTQSLVESANE